jgi:hypothetical protein
VILPLGYGAGDPPRKGDAVIRLTIAIAAGLLVGLAATVLVTKVVLTGVSNGSPSSSSLYNYGSK